jgi:hypothetical protein
MRPILHAAALALAALAGQGPALAADPPRAEPRTDAERIARGDETLNRVRAAARQVEGLVDDARREKDVLRITCLSDRLGQLQGMVGAAERASGALHEAIASRREGAEVELSALELAGLQAAEVRAQADRCLGSFHHAEDGTKVEALPPRREPEKR